MGSREKYGSNMEIWGEGDKKVVMEYGGPAGWIEEEIVPIIKKEEGGRVRKYRGIS